MTTQTWLANTTAKTEASAGTAVTLRAAQSGSSKKLTVNSGLISFLQNSSALTMSGYSLTGSQATSLLDMTGTWNTSGAPTALKLNVTDTNSNASSALLDLQVGGVSQFKVSKAGAVTAVGVAVPTISSSDTLTNKTLSSPVLSGTVSGSPTFTGALVMSGSTYPIRVSDGGYIRFYNGSSGIDWALGKPDANQLIFYRNAAAWFQFDANGAPFLNGVAIPTISSTDTLSNKTLSSPTLSGTVSGSPTFSGATTFQNYNLIIQTTSATGTSGLRFRQSDGVQRWDWGFNDNDDSIFLNRFNSSSSYQDTPIAVDSTGAVSFKGVAVPTISSTDTLSNKTLSSPTLSGTVSGTPTFSGAATHAANDQFTFYSGGYQLAFDIKSGTPGFRFWETDGPSDAKIWSSVISGGIRYDQLVNDAENAATTVCTTTRTGYASQVVNYINTTLQVDSSTVATAANTLTLSNKTLSSPTLSGTVAGTPTFSGSPIKIGDGTDTVAMTGTSPQLRVQGASFSTGITVRRDGNAEVGIQSTGTGNIGTWTAHNVQFMRNGSAMGGFDASAIFIGQVNNPRFYLYNNAGTASTLTLGADSADTFLGSFTNAPFSIYTDSAKRVSVPAAGGMVVGTAAIATNATNGFLYVPTCAGTPTGTPTTQTGTAPIVIDTTNNKLYFYSGGAWRDAGP